MVRRIGASIVIGSGPASVSGAVATVVRATAAASSSSSTSTSCGATVSSAVSSSATVGLGLGGLGLGDDLVSRVLGDLVLRELLRGVVLGGLGVGVGLLVEVGLGRGEPEVRGHHLGQILRLVGRRELVPHGGGLVETPPELFVDALAGAAAR